MTQREKDKRWKPQFDERYNGLDWDGHIFNTGCGNDEIDDWTYLTGNCFKREEEAKEYKKKIEYIARYKNYIEEHSEPIDWGDNYQPKYYARYDYDICEIEVEALRSIKLQGAIYASSEQIIRDAISKIGEKKFKKYVLEVK